MALASPVFRDRQYRHDNGDPLTYTAAVAATNTLPVPDGPDVVLFVSLAASATTDTTLAIEAGKYSGQRLTVCVVGANTLTIKNSAGTDFGSDLEVTAAQGAQFIYDAVAAKWRRV